VYRTRRRLPKAGAGQGKQAATDCGSGHSSSSGTQNGAAIDGIRGMASTG